MGTIRALLLGALLLALCLLGWFFWAEFVLLVHYLWKVFVEIWRFGIGFLSVMMGRFFLWLVKRPIWIAVAAMIPGPVRAYYKRLLNFGRDEILPWMRNAWHTAHEWMPGGRIGLVLSLVITAIVAVLGALYFGTYSLIVLFKAATQPAAGILGYLWTYIVTFLFRFGIWRTVTKIFGRLWELDRLWKWAGISPEIRQRFRLWRRSKLRSAIRLRQQQIHRVRHSRQGKRVEALIVRQRARRMRKRLDPHIP